jgi:hypothetical protein
VGDPYLVLVRHQLAEPAAVDAEEFDNLPQPGNDFRIVCDLRSANS